MDTLDAGRLRDMRVVLSHLSAAPWWGVDLPFPATEVHVTAPRNRGRRIHAVPGVRLHRADLTDVRIIRGIPVTSPVRTCLDVTRSRPLAEAVALVDGFLRAELTTLASLQSAVAALPPAPGRSAARAAIALADPCSGSVFESLTRVLFASAGLPAPQSQYDVTDSHGNWLGRVDFAWPELRVIVECDSFAHHGTREALRRDRRRYSAFTRNGWRVIAVSWADVVNDPDYVVAIVRDVLALAAA